MIIMRAFMMIVLFCTGSAIANTEEIIKPNAEVLRQQFCVVNKNNTCNTKAEYLCEADFDMKEWAKECLDADAHACLCAGMVHEKNNEIDDAIQQYQFSCDQGDAQGCYALGNIHRSQYWATKDFSYEIKAFEYFQNSCDIGYLAGCHASIDLFSKIRSYPLLTHGKYLDILQANCHAGYFPSCNLLLMNNYLRNEGMSLVRHQKISALNQLCDDFEYSYGCEYLGSFYLSEIRNEVRRKEKERLRANFELQNQTMIEKTMAKLKGDSKVQEPVFALKDYEDARYAMIIKSFDKACDLSAKGDYGCFALGKIYLFGDIVQKDYVQSEKYFYRSCARNRAKGSKICEPLVKFYNIASVDYLRRACDLGDVDSCIKAADLYVIGLSANFIDEVTGYQKVNRSSYTAIPLYRKACELQSGKGCFKESMFYFMPDGPLFFDYMEAHKYYSYGAKRLKKACDYQYEEACQQVEVFKKDANFRKYFY